MRLICKLLMVTYNEYVKKILIQILDSYKILQEINDKPGDLENIKKEMLKINGFLKVHQEKREKARDQIDKFLFENK